MSTELNVIYCTILAKINETSSMINNLIYSSPLSPYNVEAFSCSSNSLFQWVLGIFMGHPVCILFYARMGYSALCHR